MPFSFRFFAKSMTGTATWSDWLMGNLQKLPLLVASVLIMISWSSCGALALCLGTFFYFLKVIFQVSLFVRDSSVGYRYKYFIVLFYLRSLKCLKTSSKA